MPLSQSNAPTSSQDRGAALSARLRSGRLPLRARERARANVESELVFRLACAGVSSLPPADVERITDWRQVLLLAADENAVIALRNHLRSRQWSHVPPAVQRHVAMLALDRESRMRLLRNRLEESLAALNAAGIETMLLKGSALATTVYDSFAARPMRDIDLLIRPERAEEARAVLLAHGWAADSELPGDDSYATHHHLPPLRDSGASGLRLEIHRALVPAGHPFRYSEVAVWNAARVTTCGTARALVMHPTHHAAHIAIHFAWSHMLKMGAWHAFRDLSTLLAARLLDWRELVQVADEWGATSCCYWTLQLAAAISGLPVPPSVLQRLRPRWPEFLRRPLERHFATAILRYDGGCPSVRLDQALWALAMVPRRDGHGSSRPWSVSEDLQVARSEVASASARQTPRPTLQRMQHSARYIAELMA